MRARSVLCLVGGASLLLGVAASPASAAPSGKARCISELAQAGLIGPEVNPGRANVVAGTEGDDLFNSMVTEGVDVFCGFGGNDRVQDLDAGDVFLGGAGEDSVNINRGTFIGDEGIDRVGFNFGVFDGGEGDDFVAVNEVGGVVDGGDGNDRVSRNFGVFNGGDGNDNVSRNFGVFNGGPGNDRVLFNEATGVFNGGPGDDIVTVDRGGEFNQ